MRWQIFYNDKWQDLPWHFDGPLGVTALPKVLWLDQSHGFVCDCRGQLMQCYLDPTSQIAADSSDSTLAGRLFAITQDLPHERPQHDCVCVGAFWVVMCGGGVKRAFLKGASAAVRPFVAVKDPLSVTDLHATVFTAMGIGSNTVMELVKRIVHAM